MFLSSNTNLIALKLAESAEERKFVGPIASLYSIEATYVTNTNALHKRISLQNKTFVAIY